MVTKMYDINVERSYPTPYASSPLLPLLLWALASQKHSPNTKRSFETEYDYIVVGAGSSGAVVASRLSEIPCVSVLLLEAGREPPLLTDLPILSPTFHGTNIDWQYLTESQKYTGGGLINGQIKLPRGKTLGGCSTINDFNYIRGNRKDYDGWEASGATGWSYEDVLPYFKKLEDETDVRFLSNGFHSVGGPITVTTPDYQSPMKEALFAGLKELGHVKILDVNGPSQIGGMIPQQNQRNGQRCGTAKGYLVPAENRANLDIVANAFVTKVVIEDGRAVGVHVDFGKKQHFVKARKEVIVSAGSINTPQLLMLSGVGPEYVLRRHGIPVHSDLPVGLNLHDHCNIFLSFEMNGGIKTPFGERIRDEETIISYSKNKNGILASFSALGMETFLTGAYPDPTTDVPIINTYFFEYDSQTLRSGLGFRDELYNQVYLPYENKTFYSCESSIMDPKSRGYVTLKSSNPYDKPIIQPNFLKDPRDLEDLVQGMKLCHNVATSKPMLSIGSRPFKTLYPGCEHFSNDIDLYFRCIARLIVSVGHHMVGTAKMGDPRDHDTVVDPKLRVKGIKNLRVADASIMPKVPSGNTNIPSIMIGEKASDIIKETIDCQQSGQEMDASENFSYELSYEFSSSVA